MTQARQLHLNGLRVVDRWRNGDQPCHCTHCDVCGRLFRTGDIAAHRDQAHLGGRCQHEAHKDQGCRLLTMLAAGMRMPELDAWIETEFRLRDVREYIER